MKKNLLLFFALIIGLFTVSPSVFACDLSNFNIISFEQTIAPAGVGLPGTYKVVLNVCTGGGPQGADGTTENVSFLLPTGASITSHSPADLYNTGTTIGQGTCGTCSASGTVTAIGRELKYRNGIYEDLSGLGTRRRTCWDVTINFTYTGNIDGQLIYVGGMEGGLDPGGSIIDLANDPTSMGGTSGGIDLTPTAGVSTYSGAMPSDYWCSRYVKLSLPTSQSDLEVYNSGAFGTIVGDNPCTAFLVNAPPSDCGQSKYNIINLRNATATSTPSGATSCGSNFANDGGSFSTSSKKDLWIAVKVTATDMELECFKTDKTTGSSVRMGVGMAVYTGTPACSAGGGGLTLLSCDDDKINVSYPGGPTAAMPLGYGMPFLSLTGLTIGNVIYVRLFDDGTQLTLPSTDAADQFYFSITSKGAGVPPANNECSGVSTLSSSYVSTDTRPCRHSQVETTAGQAAAQLASGTSSPPGGCSSCGGGSLENPTWFKFVSDGNDNPAFDFKDVACSNGTYSSTPAGKGLQAYIFAGTASGAAVSNPIACSGLSTVACLSQAGGSNILFGTWGTPSGVVTFTDCNSTFNYISGQEYYLVVDGIAGDNCNFSVRLQSACSAAATDPTGTNQTLCSAGGTLSAGPATDAGQSGYTVAYLLVNSSNVIVANATTITGLSAPANAAGADCASNTDNVYTLYTLEYETAQGIAITNGTTTLTTIADAAGDIIGATPTATACMDLSAAGITITVKAPISLTSTATNCSWSYNTCPATGIMVMYDNDNNGSYESMSAPSINTGTTTVRWEASYTTAPACSITGTTDVNCANNFGEFASAVSLQTCTSATSGFYNTTGTGVNIIQPGRDFTGTLGTFFQNSNGLQLDGAEIKTYKNAGANVCEPQIYYVVYPTGSRPATPVFNPLTLKYKAGCPGPSSSFEDGFGPCNSTNDQKWQYSTSASPYPGGPYLDANIDLTAQAPGSYTLEVYYSIPGSNSSTSACNDIVLIGNPNTPTYTVTYDVIAPAALTSNNATVCSNNNAVTLTAIPTGSGITYQWSSGATAVSSTNTATAAPNSTSTYTVTVSTNGCSSTSTTSVTVNNAPTNASLTPSCSGTTSVLTATATAGSGGTLAYAITGLSGTAGVFNTSVIAGTTYTVTITESPSNCAVTASATASNCTPVCDNITSPGAIQSAQNACGAFDPATLTELTAPTGGTGALEYQWQISTTSATTGFTDIASANAISYDPPSVSATTWFRRCVRRAGCSAFTPTAALEMTVNPVPSPTVASVANLNCITVTSVNPSVTGLTAGPTYTYNWTGTTGGISANGTTALPTIILPGTYTVVVTNTSQGSCSNSASVIVNRRCITITDPCVCIPNTTPQAFTETVTVTGNVAGEAWTVQTITNQNGSTFSGSGVTANNALTDNGNGTYSISFTHLTADGFAITLQGPGGAADTISENGICNATTCGCAAKTGTWVD